MILVLGSLHHHSREKTSNGLSECHSEVLMYVYALAHLDGIVCNQARSIYFVGCNLVRRYGNFLRWSQSITCTCINE